jgi:hypothetical protein
MGTVSIYHTFAVIKEYDLIYFYKKQVNGGSFYSKKFKGRKQSRNRKKRPRFRNIG